MVGRLAIVMGSSGSCRSLDALTTPGYYFVHILPIIASLLAFAVSTIKYRLSALLLRAWGRCRPVSAGVGAWVRGADFARTRAHARPGGRARGTRRTRAAARAAVGIHCPAQRLSPEHTGCCMYILLST